MAARELPNRQRPEDLGTAKNASGTSSRVGLMLAREGKLDPWISAARPMVVWLIPAVLSLYVKYETTNFYAAARSFGRVELHDLIRRTGSDGLTPWERLSFFRFDVLVAFVLIPLALILLNRLLPQRWRAPLCVSFSAIVTAALFVQFRAFTQVGRFISISMLYSAASWAWHQPGTLSYYLNKERYLALTAVIVFFLLLAAGVRWRIKHRARRARVSSAPRNGKLTVSFVAAGVLSIAILPWLPRVPQTPFHGSALLEALVAYENEGTVDTGEFSKLTIPELMSRYRELANVPVPRKDSHYWARAKGCNVVYVILETASYRALPVDGNLADFPNLRRLRERSFVGLAHHTTYPYTSRAVFSIFSSWYESSLTRSFINQHPDLEVPGDTRSLNELGYKTASYAPMREYHEDDDAMFHSLGFQFRRIVDPATLTSFAPQDRLSWKPEARIARDEAAVHLLEQDLDVWLSRGEHFAVALLPQVSHAPWFDPDEKGGNSEPLMQSRALLAMQDAWLGELMQLLEKHHQLENTLIVVTGDHGVRVRYEDPSFSGGMIDEYSFHVPLLIYAPMLLKHAEPIHWITSHIDIAPTVLDLLGIEAGREFEQGMPIWSSALRTRTTYFFANHFLGADGFSSRGEFFMRSYVTESVYQNGNLHFEANNLIPKDSPSAAQVSRSITRMVALQQVWAARFAKADSLRNHIY